MGMQAFLGYPGGDVAKWIEIDYRERTKETVFYMADGTVEKYDILGIFDREWLLDNGFLVWVSTNQEWAKDVIRIEIGSDVLVVSGVNSCNSLSSVRISEYVDEIGNGSFLRCSQDLCDTHSIPGLSIVDGWVVKYDDNVDEILDLAGVVGLTNGCFINCQKITDVTLRDGIKKLPHMSFYGCSNLSSIKIPDSVMEIRADVFTRCSESIFDEQTVDGMVLVDGWAVSCISDVENIDLEGVRGIANSAFSGNDFVKSVIIPGSVKTIGRNAFIGCENLHEIYIENGQIGMGKEVFFRTGFVQEQDKSFLTFQNQSIDEIREWFDNGAFTTDAREIDITCKDGEFSFNYDFSDEKWVVIQIVSEKETTFGVIGEYPVKHDIVGVLDRQAMQDVGIDRTQVYSVQVGTDVNSIGQEVFEACQNLSSFTIPNGVSSIGKSAFNTCSRLRDVVLPETMLSIGKSAFFGCENVQTPISIPNGISCIEENSFAGCEKIPQLKIPYGVLEIGSGAFIICKSITSVDIPNSVTCIGEAAFYHCYGIQSINIPNSVLSIGRACFSHCENMISAIIQNGISCVQMEQFESCSSLSCVKLPDSIVEIGLDAFQYCGKLKNIDIPNSVTSIGGGAFDWCSSLTEITIPDGITIIDSGTFHSCKSLSSVSLPTSILSICVAAFEDCTGLSGEFTVPYGVTTIGELAFGGVENLLSISIPSTIETIDVNAFGGNNPLTIKINKNGQGVRLMGYDRWGLKSGSQIRCYDEIIYI